MTTSGLADAALPLIRIPADLYHWSASNEHGRQMHEAIDIVEADTPTADPSEVYAVTQQGTGFRDQGHRTSRRLQRDHWDACRRLLDLHPQAAAAAQVPVGTLIDWMIKFQFDGDVDYF